VNRSNDVDKAKCEIYNFYNSLKSRNNIILLKKYQKMLEKVLIFIISNIFIKIPCLHKEMILS